MVIRVYDQLYIVTYLHSTLVPVTIHILRYSSSIITSMRTRILPLLHGSPILKVFNILVEGPVSTLSKHTRIELKP